MYQFYAVNVKTTLPAYIFINKYHEKGIYSVSAPHNLIKIH